uniref:ubiquitinyl hydrolase 1 n=1 Tax=Glossina pallidipes TaxID=7398 RepID=A0A1A9ZYB5_GLOPL
MESDKILMAAGVTAAMVGAFVFWNPSGSRRLCRRRGQIAGLHNFGQTCFLNTLLQALAACPQFIAWLQLYTNGKPVRKSLISPLLNTLEVINGTHATLHGDPYSPRDVLRALNSLGCITLQEEHDAHELFHIMLSSLEEEVHRPKQLCSLSDALPIGEGNGEPLNPPSSATVTEFRNAMNYDEATGIARLVRSEARTPDSPTSVVERKLAGDHLSMKAEPINFLETDLFAIPTLGGQIDRPSRAKEVVPKRVSNSHRSFERLNRGRGKLSIWSEQMPTQVAHPFQGAMGTQIICNACDFKSTVRYDKFDSITLNLPSEKRAGLSLGRLLSDYITPEDVADVKCETCKETTIHTKSLTFAKLPACLCVHIARTIWLPTEQVCKREDYVQFPESLSMAPYSFAQPHLNSQTGSPWGSAMSMFSSSLPMNNFDELYGSVSNKFGPMFPRSLYRLLAVVVHSGEANSGHFVTYRRGALHNAHRWYYTSDTVVRDVSVDEVLSVPAYLIFYERHSQRPMS